MASVHAFEKIFGVQLDPQIRELRRLFYCGEWIESHYLHMFMLHAPDFLGYQDVAQMAKDHKAAVEMALRLKRIGNRIVALLGGREIHPVGACVGGFYRVPTRAQLETLRADLEWGAEAAEKAIDLVLTFPYPDFEQDYEYVSLVHPDEYPLNEGRVVSSRGVDVDVTEYEDNYAEQHVPYSNALFSYRKGGGSYLVGPLSRLALNVDKLNGPAKAAAKRAGLDTPCKNPFRSIAGRGVEALYAFHEALRIIDQYQPPERASAEFAVKAGTGQAATEAPRGLIFHRYTVDDEGIVQAARIVPPTAQNQKRMEEDLWNLVPKLLSKSQEEITHVCEQALRNYDPCISCATHFLKLRIERE
jgi:coenzyme F420-reducing hydrogenase alpha subunit